MRKRRYGLLLLFLFVLLQFEGEKNSPEPLLVKESCFFGDGSPFFVKEYTYDENGRLAEEEQEDSFKTLRTCYFYEPEGTLSRMEHWYNSSLLFQETYAYYEAGRQISRRRKYDWGISYEEDTWYDEQGQKSLVRGTGYNVQGGGIWKTETAFFYDSGGNLTRTVKRIWNDWTEQDAPPMSETATEFTYDSQGRLLLEQEYHTIRYSYDEQGRLIRRESSGLGNPVEEYGYDAGGNLTEKRKYAHGKLTYTYQYEYAIPFQ